MPVDLVLHKGNTLSLYRISYDSGGSALALACCLERCLDLVKIVTVNGDYVIPERLELGLEGCGTYDLCNGSVDLETVIVDDNAKIVKLVVIGKHGCLPYLTLFTLTVTHDGVDSVILIIKLSCKCHSASGRDTETERTGRHINTGDTLHIGVTLETAVMLTESFELLKGEKALKSKRGIKRGSGMTLGENESVSVTVLGVVYIYVHLLKIEIRENICDRERAAGMSCACRVSRFDNAEADLCGDL